MSSASELCCYSSNGQFSAHCLSSEYRIDYRGQAEGDLDPIIQTTPDKILWSPLPNNSIYNGAPCLTDKTDSTYRFICSVSDWMQWFEKYVVSAHCGQITQPCQVSHGTSYQTLSKALSSCLGLSEDLYTIIYDPVTKTAIAGAIAVNIECDVFTNLIQTCIESAPGAENPDSLLGLDYASGYDVRLDSGTVNGTYQFPYTQVPQYKAEAIIPANTGNNRHYPATQGTRYELRNIQFRELQASPTLIRQFNTANGRLVGANATGTWVTIDLTVSCLIEYTATTQLDNSINLNLGVAIFDVTGNPLTEYRLDSDRVTLESGTQQTFFLHGTFTYFLQGDGAAIEPRIWYGGSFQGAINLQIGATQSNFSIHTEHAIDYQARLAA